MSIYFPSCLRGVAVATIAVFAASYAGTLPSSGAPAGARSIAHTKAVVRYCPGPDAYEIQRCSASPRLPSTPVRPQLRWIFGELRSGATALTEAQVRRHFSRAYLHQVLTPAQVVDIVQQTAAQAGPTLAFKGFSSPPRLRQAVALGRSDAAGRVALAVALNPRNRIERLAIQAAQPTIVARGQYSGMVDVGGRGIFLRCTGRGGPTVVFELGLTTDWYLIQNALSRHTRVCSYDAPDADVPFSRSDHAPTPRTSADVVSDLHTLLHNAGVPGPYVLAGFSNGGLNSLLYAATYPKQMAGMVLIDGVHPNYYARRLAMLKRLLPADEYAAFRDASLRMGPRLIDSAQFDIVTSLAQTRRALARHPLPRMPLAVLNHGVASPPPPGITDFPTAADEAQWRRLQDELAALEPHSDHVIATTSDHDIPLNQPRLVVAETLKVLREARAQEPGRRDRIATPAPQATRGD